MLLYAVCIVLRLARYNAMLDVERPAYEKEYFVGMPAPAGAIGAIGPLAAKTAVRRRLVDVASSRSSIWMIGVSLLAVSTLPMRKIHTFSVPPNLVAPLLALLAIGVAASILYPYLVILVIIVGLRHPHPVRHPHPALPGRAPGGVGRQTATAARGAPGDPQSPAAPPVDDATRAAQTAGR